MRLFPPVPIPASAAPELPVDSLQKELRGLHDEIKRLQDDWRKDLQDRNAALTLMAQELKNVKQHLERMNGKPPKMAEPAPSTPIKIIEPPKPVDEKPAEASALSGAEVVSLLVEEEAPKLSVWTRFWRYMNESPFQSSRQDP